MINQLKVGKLDAARRQLETAVLLYFNDKDPVSIHTLVCAAHEVIGELNKQAGGTPLMLEGGMIKDEYKEDFKKQVRKAKNFFKHANSDPDETIDFNPETNEFYLLDACEGYEILTKEKNPYFTIYRGWFFYLNPNFLKDQTNFQIIKNKFGNNKAEYFSSMLSASGTLR